MRPDRLLFTLFCLLLAFTSYAQESGQRSIGLEDTEEVSLAQRLIADHELESAQTIVDEMLRKTEGGHDLSRASALYLKGDVLHDGFEFTQAIPYFQEALEVSAAIHSPLALMSRHMLADSYHFAGQLDSAQYHFERLLEHEEPKDSIILGLANYGLYKIYEASDRDDIALTHLYAAHDIYQAQGQWRKAAMLKMYIGVLYHRLDQDSMALAIMQESLDVLSDEKRPLEQAFIFMERSVIHKARGDYEKSESDMLKAISLAEQAGHLGIISDGSNSLADIYTETGRYDEALVLYERSLALCRENDIPAGILSNVIGLAEVSLRMKQPEKALAYAKEAKDLCDEHGYIGELLTANGLLAEARAANGDYKGAYLARSAELSMADSLETIERTTALGELREKYEREKNIRQIADLENRAAIDSLKQKGLMIGLALLAIFSVLIINREVQRKNKAKQLLIAEKQLAENEKRRLQEEIDHKNRELTSNALNMARKNEFLAQLKEQLDLLTAKEGADENIRGLQNSLKIEKQLESNWEHFAAQFTETNPTFYANLKAQYPTLTAGEKRIAALLKMTLSNKDIAHILNISDDGVKKARYRMRKKIGLSTEESLEELILTL